MRFGQITVLIVLAALTGCGVETMGTAATSAAARKQELEQAQKAEQLARQKVEQERLQAAE
jgi:hypothetical protein